jgi:F-type H+-transporting ATPase subunit b
MLEFESGLFIWTTISFGILVVLLYKVALPPLLAFLSKREQLIADSISEAEANQKKSEEMLLEYKKKLAELHHTADKIIDSAKAEATSARQSIIEKTNKQADLIMDKAQMDLVREKEKMLNEVRGQIASLVISAASKILRREVSERDNLTIIEESVAQKR